MRDELALLLTALLWAAPLVVAAGCGNDDADDGFVSDDDDDDDSDGPVDSSWGVVEACDATQSGGFGDWYQSGNGILVHGDTPEDAQLAQQVFGWYSEYVDDFQIVAYEDLTDDDLQHNLFVIGHPASNPLLVEMNGSLPVYFEQDGFFFGGYRWDGAANGIALVHPSPFAAGAWVLLYVGNSRDGSYATFTVQTGARDFQALHSSWTLHLEGDLCRDGDVWGFYPPWADDYRAGWEAWVDSLETTEGEHHLFHYLPDSDAADDIAAIAEIQETAYGTILDQLEVSALDRKIDWYFYPDNATKGDVTGNDGNGHANAMNYEVHGVYNGQVQLVGAHEDVHIVAYHRVGDTSYALMGEGLAVMVDGVWWGQPLDDWAAQFLDAGDIPPLVELIDAFWDYDDTLTYPLAGHFAGFLRDGWGMDVVKELYVAGDLESAMTTELGMSAAEVDAAWRATID